MRREESREKIKTANSRTGVYDKTAGWLRRVRIRSAFVPPACAALLGQQPDIRNENIFRNPLAHVVQGKARHGRGGQCLHLDARLAHGADAGAHGDRKVFFAGVERNLHARQRHIVAQGNEFGRALGRLDARQLRRTQHIAFGRGAGKRGAKRFLAQMHPPRRRRHAGRIGLGAHVHHTHAALGMQMGQGRSVVWHGGGQGKGSGWRTKNGPDVQPGKRRGYGGKGNIGKSGAGRPRFIAGCRGNVETVAK